LKIIADFAKCLAYIMMVSAIATFTCVSLDHDHGFRANAWEVPPKPSPSLFLDVYTQEGGKGSDAFGGHFAPDEEVLLFVAVESENVPVGNQSLALEVVGPTNSYQNISTFLRAVTNSSGIASKLFKIPLPSEHAEMVYGTWTVQSQTGLDIETTGDTMCFEVAFTNPEFPALNVLVLVFALTTATALILTHFPNSLRKHQPAIAH